MQIFSFNERNVEKLPRLRLFRVFNKYSICNTFVKYTFIPESCDNELEKSSTCCHICLFFGKPSKQTMLFILQILFCLKLTVSHSLERFSLLPSTRKQKCFKLYTVEHDHTASSHTGINSLSCLRCKTR